MDSNCESLALGATALPTEPQALSYLGKCLGPKLPISVKLSFFEITFLCFLEVQLWLLR